MSAFKQIATAAVSLAVLIGAAAAEDDITAEFHYSPATPIAETYATFQETAKKTCNSYFRSLYGTVRFRYAARRECNAMLMEKAVQATQSESLLSLHRSRTDVPETEERLAGVKN